MQNAQPHQIKTISEYHQFRGLPKPEHPLISVINFENIVWLGDGEPKSIVQDFYAIALKKNCNAKMKYGQQDFDFDAGTMMFMSPGQVFSITTTAALKHTGWLLLVHPDFLWHTPLAQKIKQYEYFSYSVHEALHLSEKEETAITGLMQNIGQEYHSSIDEFSQDVMIAQLELLLTFAERFYRRQFITRKISNHQIISSLEAILTAYFDDSSSSKKGIPTVQCVASALNVSPGYLSSLLKVLTGQSTQQHIHYKLIEKAKEKLSTTSFSVSEIAYELGFEHPQSFSKFFKTKTSFSPVEFRQSFN